MIVAGAAGTVASPDLLRIEVGDCVLEAPAAERGRLEGLALDARTLLPRVEQELGARAAAPYRITLVPVGPAMDPAVRGIDALGPSWAAGFIVPAARAGAIRVAQADRYPYADLASVLTGRLPPLAELDAAFDASDDRARAAYAASFDFLLWTVKSYGRTVVRDIVRESRVRPFPEAWQAATGVPLDRSEADWRRGSLLLYRWVPALTGTTALWTGITLLALFAGARRRARTRRILEAWQAEEEPAPPEETVH